MGPMAKAWRVVLVVGLLLVAAYLLVPAADRSTLSIAVGGGSLLCVLLGVRIQRPLDRVGWYLLAMSGAAITCGGAVARMDGLQPNAGASELSLGPALYLAGLLCLLPAVTRIGRDARRPRREDFADAAIISIGVFAISWQFLMAGYAGNGSVLAGGRLLLLSFPVLDIALVFVAFRSLVFGTDERAFCRILAAGVLVLSASGLALGMLVLHHHPPVPAAQAGFLLAAVLVGAAALHPSLAEKVAAPKTPVPSVYRRETDGRSRIPAVAFAGFVPPSILLIASRLGSAVDVSMMSALCVAVFALIYLRMMWLIGRITGQTDEIEVHARALEASHRQRDALETDLRHLAFHDELTGLANRALLHDRVEHALAAAPRAGRSVALCFGDLDGFKTVNDTLGHHVGDSVLVRASRLLSSIVRPGDTVARLGGDEFAVLMVGIEHPDAAVDFAHRIVRVLRDAPDFEGSEIGISISVGVAYGEAGKSTEQLLSEADSAMYEAKERGKNCVEVFEPTMRSRMLERLDLTNGFRWALGRSEFFLQYQPIVSLSDSRLHGFEALVRWGHPTLGQIEPLRFIPIAEETGFIVPLGRWVLVEACEQLATWSTRSGDELCLSVNLSRRQLMSPHLGEEVRTALALSGIDPHRLILEVTESVLMKDPGRAIRALAELRAMGTRIAVDDFGTGYSSLSHLQRFPVDVLKIDKTFIDPLRSPDNASAALVTAIIGLAGSLGLEVIAEGIEHESQLHRLVDLGCEHGQGFLMSRPLDGTDAEVLIADRADRADRAGSVVS
jgi:diguanylate cyclase